MTATTLYWHDYETFGADPARDRPSQFAGLRTDLDLNPIGEPLTVYCKPTPDMLPHPEACLITGITPQIALAKGVVEAEFIKQIHHELNLSHTCGAGYNSIRFDDEVTRYTLYRNFYDPYAREWQNGNSRWDIIDMVRMCYALRPEGINWPQHPDGKPSFKLEALTVANGITHTAAHDALSDVTATIALAKLIKTQQPRLYDYLFKLRNKHEAAKLLNVKQPQAILHTSSMYPSEYGCTAMVAPLALHPSNKNGIIVYDLRHSPEELITLSADEIQARLFTKTEDLPEGVERIPLKTVHINKCPALAPLNTLSSDAAERLHIDIETSERHLKHIRSADGLTEKIQAVMARQDFPKQDDPELNLYGGFFSSADKERINTVRETPAAELRQLQLSFEDARLPELFFRYRARNYPETLNPDEQNRWREYCFERIAQSGSNGINLDEYESTLQVLAEKPDMNEKGMAILEELAEYAAMLSS